MRVWREWSGFEPPRQRAKSNCSEVASRQHGRPVHRTAPCGAAGASSSSVSLENDSELQGPCAHRAAGKDNENGPNIFFKRLTEKSDKSHSFHGLVKKSFVT